MDLLPSAEQRELIEAVKGPIAEILPVSRLHPHQPRDGGTLGQLAELGCLGIALDESCGGSALTAVEEALLFVELGRQLASPSILASVLAGHVAAQGDQGKAAAIASGAEPVGLGVSSGKAGQILLIDALDQPDTILLLGAEGPALLPASALSERRLVDADQWNLPLEHARLGDAPSTASRALATRARLLVAAQLVGIAAAARDMAVSYATLREQFGKPIGAFQAVKHHCANMAVTAMAATDLLSFAAAALGHQRADADFQIYAALSTAIRAARANTAINIQVHGGMGFSDECDAHLFVKHAHVWETIAGGSEAAHAALLTQPSPMQPSRAAH